MKSPFPDHGETLGRFEGFLACVINACFTVAGPDYLSSELIHFELAERG